MSDGPHRTLPMRRCWKVFAERADYRAYELTEVGEALIPAMIQDWRWETAEYLPEIREILGIERQGSLFNTKADIAGALRSLPVITVMTRSLVAHLEMEIAGGHHGQRALENAIHSTLVERAIGVSRQIEEHYYREASEWRSTKVMNRMEGAVASGVLRTLASQLSYRDASSIDIPTKKDGLEDGVRI